MPLNEQKCAQLPDDIKYIFDEISAELCDASRNIKQIEKGTTKAEAQRLAQFAAGMVRRAGKMCAACGIRAKADWNDAD